MRAGWFSKYIAAATLLLLAAAGPVRAGMEDEVKALFGKFIAAQNGVAYDRCWLRLILRYELRRTVGQR
jgi:hypothetical protein